MTVKTRQQEILGRLSHGRSRLTLTANTSTLAQLKDKSTQLIQSNQQNLNNNEYGTNIIQEIDTINTNKNLILNLLILHSAKPKITNLRGSIISLRLDCKLDLYLRTSAINKQVKLIDIVREAILTSIPIEIIAQGKRILSQRHSVFKTIRNSFEIPAQILKDIDHDVVHYTSSSNILTRTTIIELRLLTWAATQSDWQDQHIEC